MKIGFEEILGLFFLVFFVVIPLFSKKKGPTTKGPQQPPVPRPGAPAPGAPQPSSTARGGGSVVADARGDGGSWRGMLQEIQRRVREAEAAEAAASGRGSVTEAQTSARHSTGGHMPAARTDGRLVQGQASASLPSNATGPGALLRPAATGGLVGSDPFGGGLVPGRATASGLGREGPRFVPPVEAEPARVTRLRSKGRAASGALEAVAALSAATTRPRDQSATAKLGAPVPHGQAFIGTSKSDLVRGMIWHEILSEPVAFRRLRRTR